MVIILDNVINNIDSVKVEILDILKDQNINEDWCTFDKNHKFQDFCCKFIDIASNFYDMSSCVGYEFWTQNNSRPSEWHYDKDEDFLKEKGVLHFPLCSMVYYPVVEDLQGGQLHLECDIITPRRIDWSFFHLRHFIMLNHLQEKEYLCLLTLGVRF